MIALMQIGNEFHEMQLRCHLLAERNFDRHHKHDCRIAQEKYIKLASYYNKDLDFNHTSLNQNQIIISENRTC